MNKHLKTLLKILVCILIIGIIAISFTNRDKFSIDYITSILPQNLLYGAVVLMILYTIKGVSVFFPILLLQIAGGLMFPPLYAFILNCLGTALSYTLPYIIGRVSGKKLTDKIAKKYKKFDTFVKAQKNSKAYSSFILRAVSCLPADIVSLYLGSIDVPYIPYVLWSVIGTLPGLIPATFMGLEMTNPTSPAFIASVVATVLSAVISSLIYYFVKKPKQSKNIQKY